MAGVRYGKSVEDTNKKMTYILSITPHQPSITLQPEKTLNFQTYTHQGCGLQFLYPNLMEKTKETANSAQFTLHEKSALEFSCYKPNELMKAAYIPEKTEDITFKGRVVKAEVRQSRDKTVYLMDLAQPNKNRTIVLQIDKNLYPLFENSAVLLP